jgi:hypothetical protein
MPDSLSPEQRRRIEREQVIENIVRHYLDRDEIREGIADWLTNVYADDLPPVADLLDRIAVERPLPEPAR